MTETKTNPIFHLMPSLTDVAFILPLLFLFGGLNGVRTLIGDGDTGWHIRAGDWIRAHAQVPYQDMFSFTRPGQPWFAWEWLWDVCFSWIHRSFGLGGVALVSILVICVTSALLYKLLLRVTAQEGLENPLVAIGLTGLTIGAASMHWLARPHLFSMLFVVVFMSILERGAGKPAKVRPQPEGPPHTNSHAELANAGRSMYLLWMLPVLMILWTNLHGGFFIGLILVGTYAAGTLLRAAVERDSTERAKYLKSGLRYAAATAALRGGEPGESVRLPFIRTHLCVSERSVRDEIYPGVSAYSIPVGLVDVPRGNADPGGSDGHLVRAAEAVHGSAAAGGVGTPIADRGAERPDFHDRGGAAGGASAGALDSGGRGGSGGGMAPLGGDEPGRNRAGDCRDGASVAGTRDLRTGADGDRGRSRVAADCRCEVQGGIRSEAVSGGGAFAVLREPGQRIFTPDEWGGYLIYALSPQGTKVYVDGRSDFYGEKFDDEFVGLMNVKFDWEKTLARYGVDTILLPADAPLAGAIKESRHWRVSYDDGLALVFRPAEAASGINPQVSADSFGGGGGRDLPVTAAIHVRPEEHVIQTTKQKERE